MAYLVRKIVILATLILLAQSQNSQSIPQPDPSWDDWKVKACCPQGFVEVNNYCVQCNTPYVFDAVDQRCRPCPTDHVFNNATKTCDCKIPCELPRQLNANNVCECPADQKGNRRLYNPNGQAGTCDCPSNLPLWNGKYCVACPSGTEYDPKEHQCYHCPEGFTRDYTTHNCVPGF